MKNLIFSEHPPKKVNSLLSKIPLNRYCLLAQINKKILPNTDQKTQFLINLFRMKKGSRKTLFHYTFQFRFLFECICDIDWKNNKDHKERSWPSQSAFFFPFYVYNPLWVKMVNKLAIDGPRRLEIESEPSCSSCSFFFPQDSIKDTSPTAPHPWTSEKTNYLTGEFVQPLKWK